MVLEVYKKKWTVWVVFLTTGRRRDEIVGIFAPKSAQIYVLKGRLGSQTVGNTEPPLRLRVVQGGWGFSAPNWSDAECHARHSAFH